MGNLYILKNNGCQWVHIKYYRIPFSQFDTHGFLYRQALTYIIYDIDTIHLMTRHQQTIPAKGYLHPMTYSSWFAYIMTMIFAIAIMHLTNYWYNKGKLEVVDPLPFLYFLHFDDTSPIVKMMSKLHGGRLQSDKLQKLYVCVLFNRKWNHFLLCIDSFFIFKHL